MIHFNDGEGTDIWVRPDKIAAIVIPSVLHPTGKCQVVMVGAVSVVKPEEAHRLLDVLRQIGESNYEHPGT